MDYIKPIPVYGHGGPWEKTDLFGRPTGQINLDLYWEEKERLISLVNQERSVYSEPSWTKQQKHIEWMLDNGWLENEREAFSLFPGWKNPYVDESSAHNDEDDIDPEKIYSEFPPDREPIIIFEYLFSYLTEKGKISENVTFVWSPYRGFIGTLANGSEDLTACKYDYDSLMLWSIIRFEHVLCAREFGCVGRAVLTKQQMKYHEQGTNPCIDRFPIKEKNHDHYLHDMDDNPAEETVFLLSGRFTFSSDSDHAGIQILYSTQSGFLGALKRDAREIIQHNSLTINDLTTDPVSERRFTSICADLKYGLSHDGSLPNNTIFTDISVFVWDDLQSYEKMLCGMITSDQTLRNIPSETLSETKAGDTIISDLDMVNKMKIGMFGNSIEHAQSDEMLEDALTAEDISELEGMVDQSDYEPEDYDLLDQAIQSWINIDDSGLQHLGPTKLHVDSDGLHVDDD